MLPLVLHCRSRTRNAYLRIGDNAIMAKEIRNKALLFRKPFFAMIVLALNYGAFCMSAHDMGADKLVVKDDVLVHGPRNAEGTAVIPKGVHHIAEHAFMDCRNVTSVVFPQEIESIGDFAFMRCYGLEKIDVPKTVTNIGVWAFSLCRNMTNAIVNAAIDDVSQGMFEDCMMLKHVQLPTSLRKIGKDSFRNCRSLRNVAIPAGVTNISEAAFAACSSLERVVLPEGLKVLGDKAFGWCYNLPLVNVPVQLDEMGSDVFIDNVNLRNAISNGDVGLSGLAKVACIAVDGFLLEGPDCHVDFLALDRFAAHVNEFRIGMSYGEVEYVVKRFGYGFGHGTEKGENGSVINKVTFIKFGMSKNGGVNLCLEYINDKLCNITLSEAFKCGVWAGIRRMKKEADNDVLQWL